MSGTTAPASSPAATTSPDRLAPRTPADAILTASLLIAPLLYLAADSAYAALGWDSGTAGCLHVLGAIAYGLVIVRVAEWLPGPSRLRAAVLLTGLIGLAGNVAYGFEAIHQSLGDVPLVDQPGAATLIKPLGLFFPVSFLLVAAALVRLGHRIQQAAVAVAMIGWPIAHIGNIAPLAVAVNILLVLAFGSLLVPAGQRT